MPAYDYPGEGVWDPLIKVASYTFPGRLIVVANLESGPGYNKKTGSYRPPDPNYVRSIAALRNACATVVGYVHDCYGDTNPSRADNCPRHTNIVDDIKRWFEIYKVDGIFIDQTSPTDLARAAWLTSVVRARKNGATIVFNPGTIPSLEFMEATDPAVVVVQEQTFHHFKTWPPDGWVKDRSTGNLPIPARRLAILAHTPQDGETDVDSLLEVAGRYHIGSIYANHANGPDYNTLSTFLPAIGPRLCRLRSRFGLPCQIANRPLCAASQVFKLVRSVRK